MRNGFTLIELLVALALLAGLGVLTLQVLGLGLETRSRVVLSANETRRAAIALETVRRLIEQVQPPDRQRGGERPATLRGEADRITLLTRVSTSDDPRPRHGRLWLEAGHLVLDHAPGSGARRIAGQGGETARTVLLRDVEGLDIAYYGRREADEAPAWHRDWPGAAGLPAQVRLELVHAGRRWPALIAAPRRQSLLR